jgi:type IV secretory pathway VirB2 component (pilin)
MQEVKQMKTQYAKLGLFAFIFALMVSQFVLAVDFNQDISSQDKATFDQILQPVMKVYNLVKYTATVLAVVVLLFAGITYMLSGSEPGKREKAKNMAMYVIIGLIVIWAAPLVVNFILG